MKLASLLFGSFHKIPPEWHEDFQREWIATCYARCRAISWVNLVYPLVVFIALTTQIIGNEQTHTILLAITSIGLSTISLITLFSYQNIHSPRQGRKYQYNLTLLYSLALMIFMNSSFLIIWIKTGTIAPYIIGTFIYALIFYQPNLLGFFIYLSNYIFYLICISTFTHPFDNQFIAYFSGFVGTFGSWFIASMLFNSRVQDFMSRRTILIQSQELSKINRELIKLVDIDGLTQVANRRRFDRYLCHKYQQLLDKSALGILMCDIDYFKLFNDTYGHQAGDECLQRIAATIQASVRQDEDLVARYGGEEFVVILCNTSEVEAVRVAQRICAQVQNLHVPHDRSPLHEVTISVGISCQIPSSICSSEQLISQADRALYQAKSIGRNQAVYLES